VFFVYANSGIRLKIVAKFSHLMGSGIHLGGFRNIWFVGFTAVESIHRNGMKKMQAKKISRI